MTQLDLRLRLTWIELQLKLTHHELWLRSICLNLWPRLIARPSICDNLAQPSSQTSVWVNSTQPRAWADLTRTLAYADSAQPLAQPTHLDSSVCVDSYWSSYQTNSSRFLAWRDLTWLIHGKYTRKIVRGTMEIHGAYVKVKKSKDERTNIFKTHDDTRS